MGGRKENARSKDYTGECIIWRTFGGTQERYELAWIKIRSPFINIRVKCAIIQNPYACLILGNAEDVKEVDDSDLEE